VTSWSNRDEAFVDIARGILAIVERFELSPTRLPRADELPSLEEVWVRRPPVERALDAAIPSHVVKDRATELLVLIRLPGSEGLKGVLQADDDAEAKLEDVRSKDFEMVFPVGSDGRPEPLRATIKVTSLDFSPAQQEKNVFMPPDGDSHVAQFMLIPLRVGPLRVLIELQWEEAVRGSRRLRTECVAEASAVPPHAEMIVASVPIGSADVTEAFGAVPPPSPTQQFKSAQAASSRRVTFEELDVPPTPVLSPHPKLAHVETASEGEREPVVVSPVAISERSKSLNLKSPTMLAAYIGAIALIGAAFIPSLPQWFSTGQKKPAYISGVVTDALTKAPLGGVVVQLETNEGKSLTHDTSDGKGKFNLTIPPESTGVRLVATMAGYDSFDVKLSAQDIKNDVELQRQKVAFGIPDDLPLQGAVEIIGSKLNITVVFARGCSKAAMATRLNGGQLEADPRVPEKMIEDLLNKVRDGNRRYAVTPIEAGKRYEIRCL
jgi:hypothetical protein